MGCNTGLNLPGQIQPSGEELAGVGLQGRGTYREIENNGSLAAANILPAEADPQTVIQGSISTVGDVDVFDLGPVAAQEKLVVQLNLVTIQRPRLALFDASGSALMIDDTLNLVEGHGGVFVEAVFRQDADHAYAGVASEPGTGSTGDYTLIITRSFVDDVPPPRPQVVYLNFDGAASVRLGPRPPADIPAFDPADIMGKFAGQDDALIAATLEKVRADYAGLNVVFSSSRESPPPHGSFATIHVGGYDADALGVAESVDENNWDPGQQAIVFAKTFASFAVLNPSEDQISQALANVISHEVGHLLGLSHTRDPRAIMDVTASLSQMLGGQSFRRSPLFGEVFPIGEQDALECLYEAVGGDFQTVQARRTARAIVTDIGLSADASEPARAQHAFTMCFCGRCEQQRARSAQAAPCGQP
ncbi:MAG TPA: matrixin family metalloprotease [Phycisphaerae bacterium]